MSREMAGRLGIMRQDELGQETQTLHRLRRLNIRKVRSKGVDNQGRVDNHIGGKKHKGRKLRSESLLQKI